MVGGDRHCLATTVSSVTYLASVLPFYPLRIHLLPAVTATIISTLVSPATPRIFYAPLRRLRRDGSC
ncbi:hypothetical protein BT69DRAFT_335400 [Atractiella rhizophila]|nr:hypothetical protein BT69DRAFT_335400 [Atractiella rhizophila]